MSVTAFLSNIYIAALKRLKCQKLSISTKWPERFRIVCLLLNWIYIRCRDWRVLDWTDLSNRSGLFAMAFITTKTKLIISDQPEFLTKQREKKITRSAIRNLRAKCQNRDSHLFLVFSSRFILFSDLILLYTTDHNKCHGGGIFCFFNHDFFFAHSLCWIDLFSAILFSSGEVWTYMTLSEEPWRTPHVAHNLFPWS